jgi:hypothetical protein
MRYKYLAVAVIAAVAAFAPSTPASAAVTNTPLDCANVVATPGGYRLTADVTCNLRWDESAKSLDLRGHTFDGAMLLHGNGLTIRNGTLHIAGLNSASFGSKVTFSQLRINGGFFDIPFADMAVVSSTVNSARFDFYFEDVGTLSRSVFNNSSILVQRSSDIHITRNVFTGKDSGVTVGNYIPGDTGQTNRTIVRNNVFGNQSFGITLKPRFAVQPNFPQIMDGTIVAGNVITGAPGSGISIDVVCTPSTSEGACPRAGHISISGNTLVGNGAQPATTGYDDGITARGSGDALPPSVTLGMVTVAGNRSYLNADLGYDVTGVTDGGGNTAALNGDRTQCVGVVCHRPR